MDPETLELQHRFDDLYAACLDDELLAESAAGEPIDSEIEIRSGKSASFAEAMERQRERRARLFSMAEGMGLCLAGDREPTPGPSIWTSGSSTRPTMHGCRTSCAGWPNETAPGAFTSTSAFEVPTGPSRYAITFAASFRAPRAVRELARSWMAATGTPHRTRPRSSPARSRGAASTSRSALGLHTPTSSTSSCARTRSSRRPSSGGACGRTTRSARSSFGSAMRRPAVTSPSRSPAMIAACVAQSALDYDAGRLPEPLRQREIEENLWRAIRHGMDGKLIDFDRRRDRRRARRWSSCSTWTAPARASRSASSPRSPTRTARSAARAALWPTGASIEQIYRESVAETQAYLRARAG